MDKMEEEIKVKKSSMKWIIIGFIILIFFIILLVTRKYSGDNILDVKESNAEDEDFVTLSFFDLKSSCALDGKVFLNEYLVGNSTNGLINLSREEYDTYFIYDSTFSIKGVTDECFDKNKNLPFEGYWTISDLEYYFTNEQEVEFEITLTPRQPISPGEMQGFVRPDEVEDLLLEMRLDENASISENINKIFGRSYFNYASDLGIFKEREYWQTPAEFAKGRMGDCEDWAIYTLSLLRSYDSEIKCYLAGWDTHMNLICQIGKTFTIYDQDKIRESVSIDSEASLQENKVNIRSWMKNYFKRYGFSVDERNLYYLFNDKEYIEFGANKEDFIDWVINEGWWA